MVSPTFRPPPLSVHIPLKTPTTVCLALQLPNKRQYLPLKFKSHRYLFCSIFIHSSIHLTNIYSMPIMG